MTAEERAIEALADCIDEPQGVWLPRITAALREAEAEAMERVARRAVNGIRISKSGCEDTTILRSQAKGGQVFTVWRTRNGRLLKSVRCTSFAAALAALTPEERAAWESEG